MKGNPSNAVNGLKFFLKGTVEGLMLAGAGPVNIGDPITAFRREWGSFKKSDLFYS